MTLWNPTAKVASDYIDRAEGVFLKDTWPPEPLPGSRTYWTNRWVEFGTPSVWGEYGGIQAAESDDIGSPGFMTNHPPRTVAVPRPPRCLRVARDAQGVHLTWSTQCEKHYELQSKDDLAAPAWTPLSQHPAAGPQTTTTDATCGGAPSRFYRLLVLPDAP